MFLYSVYSICRALKAPHFAATKCQSSSKKFAVKNSYLKKGYYIFDKDLYFATNSKCLPKSGIECMSEKIEIKKSGSGAVIFIAGKMKNWHESVLLAWLVLWTVCGIYIMYSFFQITNQDEKMFLLVYLAFWAYFEYMAARAWIWRRKGKEILKIGEGRLEIRNNLKGFGNPKTYFIDNIKDLKVNTSNSNNSFAGTYNKSFWIVGGGSIAFTHLGKEVIFGRQLNAEDCQKVLTALRKYFKRKK
tara:strand:+ start:14578 stop:15312 length:735 start_codon:yes stop_codon:yes gene_type:complete